MVGANLWLEHLHGWSIYGWSICTVGASMVRAFSRLEQLDSDIADYGWSGLWLEQIYSWNTFMVGAFMVGAFPRLEQLDSDVTDYGWSRLFYERIYGCSIPKFRFLSMVGASRTEQKKLEYNPVWSIFAPTINAPTINFLQPKLYSNQKRPI